MVDQQEAAARGRQQLAPLGDALSKLREQPATAFLRIAPQGFVIDGRLLLEETTDVFSRGRQAPIPLLAGWNSDEASVFAPQGALGAFSIPESGATRVRLEGHYGPELETDGRTARRALIGDRRFAYPVWRWACTHVATLGAATWIYELDHPPPVPDDVAPAPDGLPNFGTFHTAELPYTWDNLAVRSWAWREEDRVLAKQLADTWVRFIAHSNPNGSGAPMWPRFDPLDGAQVMHFGTSPRAGSTARRAAFEQFDEILGPRCGAERY